MIKKTKTKVSHPKWIIRRKKMKNTLLMCNQILLYVRIKDIY